MDKNNQELKPQQDAGKNETLQNPGSEVADYGRTNTGLSNEKSEEGESNEHRSGGEDTLGNP